METGVETEEVNQQVGQGERGSDFDDADENPELTQLSDTSSQCNSRELSTGDQSSQCSGKELSASEDEGGLSSHKHQEKLDETFKHKRMEKRMPADAQMTDGREAGNNE